MYTSHFKTNGIFHVYDANNHREDDLLLGVNVFTYLPSITLIEEKPWTLNLLALLCQKFLPSFPNRLSLMVSEINKFICFDQTFINFIWC